MDIIEDSLIEYYKKPLNFTSKFGLFFLFILISALIIFSTFLKYPDTIEANIVISSDVSPVKLYAKKEGNLVLFSNDNSEVTKEKLIGGFSNYGNLEQILKLRTYIDEIKDLEIRNFDSFLMNNLGVLQPYYHDFIINFRKYENISQDKQIEQEILNRKAQIKIYSSLLKIKKEAIKVNEENNTLNKKDVERNLTLYKQKIISTLELEKVKMNQNILHQSLLALRSEAKVIELNIKEQQRLIGELIQNNRNNLSVQSATLANSIDMLKLKIIEWLNENTFSSPLDGKLIYPRFLQNYQYIKNGDHIFSIMPYKYETKIGRVLLPVNNSGKVKIGNTVMVKLIDFNYQEFGVLYGKVAEISNLPKDNHYLVKVEFPHGLISTYNINLDEKNSLQGVCEIITEDISLFNRIFMLFNSLVHNPI